MLIKSIFCDYYIFIECRPELDSRLVTRQQTISSERFLSGAVFVLIISRARLLSQNFFADSTTFLVNLCKKPWQKAQKFANHGENL